MGELTEVAQGIQLLGFIVVVVAPFDLVKSFVAALEGSTASEPDPTDGKISIMDEKPFIVSCRYHLSPCTIVGIVVFGGEKVHTSAAIGGPKFDYAVGRPP